MKQSLSLSVTTYMKSILLGIICLSLVATSCSNIGETAPEFTFTTIDSNTIDSNSLKDKIIVVNVWATWCPTCIKEIPELNRLQAKYASDTSIVFLGLCDESQQLMDNILTRFPFNYKQVAEAQKYTSKLQTRLVKTYPQNLIIDHNFNIVFEVSDGSADIFSALDTKLQELVNLPTN